MGYQTVNKTVPELNSNADINQLQANITVLNSRLYTRQISVQYDSATYTLTTAWSLTMQFTEITGFQAGSKIKLFYHVPCRNDAASWGGVYLEPQISFNSGTNWYTLGSSGYDGGVMNNGVADIGSYNNTIYIDPALSSAFSVKIRFYAKTYDGTGYINANHDINAVSATASYFTNNVNTNQHYAHIIVEELAIG